MGKHKTVATDNPPEGWTPARTLEATPLEFWDPAEGESIVVTLREAKEGKYGPFIVADREDGNEVGINIQSALKPLLKMLDRKVWLQFTGLNGRAKNYRVAFPPDASDDDIPF